MERRRQLRGWERQLERFASSRPGTWFFVHVAPAIDRVLMPLSRGRLRTAVRQPSLILTTVGAKSGRERRTPLLYLARGDDLVVIASRGGDTRHPAWYHNLRANPEVKVELGGRRGRYLAREAEGPEREQLWREAVDLYAGYDVYRERAGSRRIPVIVLTPVDAPGATPRAP